MVPPGCDWREWVDVNKSDTVEPDYRSRSLGREFAVGRDNALYATTPPLEALGLIISHAATIPEEYPKCTLMINDVCRAFFCEKINRDVYIELPEEDGYAYMGPGMLPMDGRRHLAHISLALDSSEDKDIHASPTIPIRG